MTYQLEEGYYWYDKTIIKAFDKEGNIHKILKLKIDDELNIEFKEYKNKPFDMATWQDIVELNKDRLEKLETHSIKLIKEITNIFDDRTPANLTSGGKDSSVTTYLTRKALNENVLQIFNNTSLDCADTYLHIKKENNLMIINPKEGFYNWRERNNFVGNRTARACCTVFKEGAMVESLNKDDKYVFFMGMRNQESNTRSGYADLWKNEKWGNREWDGCLPIRSWTELDIWLYILWRGIDINPKYKKGYTRVGCVVACPFYSKSTWVLDEYWYPHLYKRWHNILELDFINNRKAPILNCTLKEYHMNWNGTGVREEATEEVIQEFAQMHNLEIDLARKYFNKRCMCCDKKLKKNDIALSMKFYGRHIEKFRCGKCIGKEFDLTNKQIKEKIEEFKSQGCNLF